ncbi:hypothetical protein [Sphingobacterium sp. ML3W]|uniref:hypothetical protein n=1 Tax=Sphingobacterium sp. ML3W TaxID=1538644 RepID=UPI00068E08B3|nr:hypothetical protein [Sphingobacterium sp. ML3W]
MKNDRLETLGKIHAFEELVSMCDQVLCPIRDRFVGKMYIRECTMPARTMVVSKMHKTEHPFVISQGKISVFTEDTGWVLMEAPFTGVTIPGTKRILFAHEDTVWTTFHVTDKTTAEEVEKDIIVHKELEI